MPASKAKAKAHPSKAAKSARKSSPETYTDPTLRDRLKAEIQGGDEGGRAGEWSARKSQLLAAASKKAGGGYAKAKAEETEAQKSLEEWTDEDWTAKDGEPAVREDETAKRASEREGDFVTPEGPLARRPGRGPGGEPDGPDIANRPSPGGGRWPKAG